MARTRSRSKGKSRPQSRSRVPTSSPTSANGGRQVRTAALQARPGRAGPTGPAQAATATANEATARPRPASAPAAAISGPPPWLRLTTFILSIAGLGVSIYLTIVHYSTSVSLACPNTGTVNCEKVINSPESIIFGIPVAVYGLAFFVFMVAVNNPLAWRSRLPLIAFSRLASVIAGMGFVIYLIYVELFKVNAICLWCTSVHVITFALFVITLMAAATWGVGKAAERRD